MTETKDLTTLIGDIYDAALDPALWVPTLANAARFTGGHVATLFSKNAGSQTGANVYDSGIPPHYTQLYFDSYIRIDPLSLGHVFAEIDEPVATSDLVPYDEFLQSRFYEEWARPRASLISRRRCSTNR